MFNSGDRWRPTANQLNGYDEAFDFVRNYHRSGGACPDASVDYQYPPVFVQNKSGVAMGRFSVLGIDGPIFSPADAIDTYSEKMGLKGITPSVSSHLGKWAVLMRPLDTDALGPAVASGIAITRVYVNGRADQYVDVIAKKTVSSEDCYLGTGGSGAKILWRDNASSGQGTIVWAVVRLGESSGLLPLILFGDAAPGDTSIQAYRTLADGTADTSADKVTIKNTHPGNFRGYGSNHSGFSATTAAKVWCAKDNNGDWQIVDGKSLAKTIIVANTASGHAAVAAGTTSFTATFTRVCDDGQVPTASSPATLVVYNPGFKIDDSAANITCVMDTGTGVSNCLFRIIDAPCPA